MAACLTEIASLWKPRFRALTLIFSVAWTVFASPVRIVAEDAREAILGEAILREGAYTFLGEISDKFGPRMIGTKGHRLSLDYLEQQLAESGIAVERQAFAFPGWVRGDPEVSVLAPFARTLRAIELGYVEPTEPVIGSIEYIDTNAIDTVLENDLRGKVLLLKPNVSFRSEELQRLSDAGALAALMINRVNGGLLLARVSNHHGHPTPFPMLSITQEEGMWLKRLIDEGQTVEVSVQTGSRNQKMEGTNLIATLPGESEETIVLGAHFDSWDLGQGAIDNGLGVAQLYDAAKMLKQVSPKNKYTIKFVWFDAEEFGLWGSKHYVEAVDLEEVRLMINLDMVGRPIALNAMGFDALVEPLETFSAGLGSWSFAKPVANKTWLGSDHHPFILKGVPSITFNAPLDHEDARYYHDFGDTFDKIDREMLGRASGIITLLLYDLANDDGPELKHLNEAEVMELFRKAGAEARMKRSGQWPF